jgi:hypothetical protein
MLAAISLLVVLSLSILITRIATVALAHTGLSQETARFQARSAFTGVGFTTTEAESVDNHPVRRRILMLLMLLGNAGIVTAVASMMLTFVTNDESNLGDFAISASCMDGPDIPVAPGCEVSDLDTDGFADLRDFAAFQNAFGCP